MGQGGEQDDPDRGLGRGKDRKGLDRRRRWEAGAAFDRTRFQVFIIHAWWCKVAAKARTLLESSSQNLT